MVVKRRKKRVPELKYTKVRDIGWHVSFRDPETGIPRKHRFEAKNRADADREYHEWVVLFLKGELPERPKKRPVKRHRLKPDNEGGLTGVAEKVLDGSLVRVASSLLNFEESRVRRENEPRRRGSITRNLFQRRKQYSKEFLRFINDRQGAGAVGRLRLSDLTMHDIEAYNRSLIDAELSASQVSKRLRFVKAVIDRAGRPEHGAQVLTWNWDSRDVLHGKPAKKRALPTLSQLKLILKECSPRETAMVWMAIGCGFGQRDLAAVRVGQVDKKGYDLRRGKTGIDRYGDTPLMVWNAIAAYLKAEPRETGDLMFLTRKRMPLVHENCDSVAQWWMKLRDDLKEAGKGLGGFYVLRHLGATEFGSRPGCSIGEMKRWLGHSASSHVADVYMKPVSPESRPLIEWVRTALQTGKADLRTTAAKRNSQSRRRAGSRK
jgi:integrase